MKFDSDLIETITGPKGEALWNQFIVQLPLEKQERLRKAVDDKCKSLNKLEDTGSFWGNVRQILQKKFKAEKSLKALEKEINDLKPWSCIWDYYLMAFYESIHNVLPDENVHPFVKQSLFKAFEYGLGFVINLGGFLVGITLPKVFKDAETRLHNENGPAIIWGDEETYWWHGVRVAEKIIMDPESIPVEEVLKEQNQEIKRCMVEAIGYDRLVEKAGFEVMAKDDFGKLIETIDIGDDASKKPRYCDVIDPSTGKRYLIRVPPETKTCVEGLAWSADMTVEEYIFDCET